MSLLQSAIGRGLEELGATASRGYLMNAQAAHEKELEEARALRAENLARLKNQWENERDDIRAERDLQAREEQRDFLSERDDAEYRRGPSGVVSSETGKPMNRMEAERAKPEEYMTAKEYDQRNETERSKAIGEAIAPVAQGFQWDAKDPQKSAMEYMQKLRATGELTEAEVAAEANKMMQARMPKEAKLQIATIPVGSGQEQAAIVNLSDGSYKLIGRAGQKFKGEEGGGLLAGQKGRLTENQASAIILKLEQKRANGEELTDGEEMLYSAASERLGKGKRTPAQLADVFQGDGRQSTIPPRGQQPKAQPLLAAAKKTAPAKQTAQRTGKPSLGSFWNN